MHRRVPELLEAVHVNVEPLAIAEAGLEELPVLLNQSPKVREVGVVEQPLLRRRAVALLCFFDLAPAPSLDLLPRAALLDPFFACFAARTCSIRSRRTTSTALIASDGAIQRS